jgi:hypothetical protein
MLLPGTFVGVWNLVAISGDRDAAHIAPEWIQGPWPRSDLRLDCFIHTRHWILLAFEDG